MDPYSRTRLLLGNDAMNKLRNAHVAVFGLGGVGGYVVELDTAKLLLPQSGSCPSTRISRLLPFRSSTDRIRQQNLILLGMIMWWMPSTPLPESWPLSSQHRLSAHPLSVAWVLAISWIPVNSKLLIFPRPPSVLWPGSCGRNAPSGASSI